MASANYNKTIIHDLACSIENFVEDLPSKCVSVYEGCQQSGHTGAVS